MKSNLLIFSALVLLISGAKLVAEGEASATPFQTETTDNAISNQAPKDPKTLIENLNNKEPSIRSQSMQEIARQKIVDAVNPLIEIVRNKQEPVQIHSQAINTIGLIGNPQAVAFLKEVFKDASFNEVVRTLAGRNLERINKDDTVAFFVESMKNSNDPILLGVAGQLLAREPKIEWSPLFVKMIENGVNPLQLNAALSAIAQLKSKEATAPLSNLLSKSKEESQEDLRGAILLTLLKIGTPEAIEVVKSNTSGVKNPQVIAELLSSFSQMSDPKLSAVILPFLKHENDQIKILAAYTLGNLGSPESAKPLVELYVSKWPKTSEPVKLDQNLLMNLKLAALTVNALRSTYPHEGIEVFKQAALPLNVDTKEEVPFQFSTNIDQTRELALDGLIAALDPSVVDFILQNKLQEDKSPLVRAKSMEILGFYGSEKGTDALIKGLSDSDAKVRWEAAWAIGQVKSPKAIDALIGALKDSHPQVVLQAQNSLKRFDDPRAKQALLLNPVNGKQVR